MTYETLLFILPRTTAPMKNCSKWEIGKKETYYIITFSKSTVSESPKLTLIEFNILNLKKDS